MAHRDFAPSHIVAIGTEVEAVFSDWGHEYSEIGVFRHPGNLLAIDPMASIRRILVVCL